MKRYLICALLCSCVHVAQILPLRILFVVSHFPAPSQTFILNQMTGLIDRGHEVAVFSYNKDSFKDCHPDIISYKLHNKIAYKDLLTEIAKNDIVFCQFGYLGVKVVKALSKAQHLKNKKVVTCLRGADITAKYSKDPEKYRRLFKNGDLFLPVCMYFKKLLITKCHCPANKIAIQYSAIDIERFPFHKKQVPENGHFVCLSVCRLVEKKGITYAIDAIARLVKKYPHIRYYIVGDGPNRSALENQIKKLGMKDNIFLTGWKSQAEVASMMNKAHVFILASITASDGNQEGIPNALKESMAAGLPTIGSWHAGNSELIKDNVSGFLVKQKSIDDLERVLEYVFTHGERWDEITTAARKTIEDKFEVKNNSMQLEQIFLQLLGKKSKSK